MMTMVPKFSLPPIKPEIVFVIDRSGSMDDKIPTLKSALMVFLKSLPVGVCFNICSFGSYHSFLWNKSVPYDKASLEHAMQFVENIESDMGGTETQDAVEATVKNRLKGKQLEVMLLTDGQIWDQDALFEFVRQSSADNRARFFSLGIGDAASHSLVEGVARAGNGFGQSVLVYEDLSKKVVRMLKGALSPHVHDYDLEVEYDTDTTDTTEATDWCEIVEGAVSDSATEPGTAATPNEPQKPISLFDSDYKEPDIKSVEKAPSELPKLTAPDLLQAPWKIPTLYPLVRTTICVLIDSRLSDRKPKALTLRASSEHGPLQLRIPIQDIGKGETIHQIASRKAVIELEEGHGWVENAKDSNGSLVKDFSPETKRQLAIRECHNLGIKYQVTGQHCSFVALDQNGNEQPEETKSDYEECAAASADAPELAKSASGFGTGSPVHRAASLFGRSPAAASAPTGGGLFGAPSTSADTGDGRHSSNSTIPTAPQPVHYQYSEQVTSLAAQTMRRRMQQVPEPSPPATKTSTLDEIIKLQTFEGSWVWSPEIITLLGVDAMSIRDKVITQLNQANQNGELLFVTEVSAVVATMLVMGYLERKVADKKAVWELVYEKAEGWLEMVLGGMGEIRGAVEGCKEIVLAFV